MNSAMVKKLITVAVLSNITSHYLIFYNFQLCLHTDILISHSIAFDMLE
jgi:hypothetical protein